MLGRKSEHTLLEGSRRGRTRDASGTAPSTGSSHEHRLLPVEGAESIRHRAVEHCAPSFLRRWQQPTNECAIMDASARRRCHCAGWVRPVPEPNTSPRCSTLARVWLMHSVRVTPALDSHLQVAERPKLWRRWDCSAFQGSFGSYCARAVRERRCGSVCADRIVAIGACARSAAMRLAPICVLYVL